MLDFDCPQTAFGSSISFETVSGFAFDEASAIHDRSGASSLEIDAPSSDAEGLHGRRAGGTSCGSLTGSGFA